MNKYKSKEDTGGFVRDKWEKRTDVVARSMRVRKGRRGGEKGGEGMVIRRRYCLQGFPGSMGKRAIRRFVRSLE